jgi:transposase
MLRDAIGLDPDARGFASAYVKTVAEKVKIKTFLSSQENLAKFISWVKKQGDVIIAIEGSNGQSKPIEKALRAEGIVFYSFKPADVSRFRKAVLGQNKNNDRDAESVARFEGSDNGGKQALEAHSSGKRGSVSNAGRKQP